MATPESNPGTGFSGCANLINPTNPMHKLIMLLLLCPFTGLGGGFEYRLHGQRAGNMAGAFTAVSSDASAIYYNPGAMVRLEQAFNISAGGYFNSTSSSFLSGFNNQVDAETVSSAMFSFFGSVQVGEKWSGGLGFYSPYGFHFNWGDEWEGRFVAQESELAMSSIQPTVSYALGEKLGAGAGFIYSYGTWDQRRAVPAGNDYGEAMLTGDGTAMGFTVGLFYAFDEDLNFGLTYRSAQTFSMDDGSFSYSSLPASVATEYPAAGAYHADLSLPYSLTAAVAYKFTDELLTTAELTYTGWSALDSVTFSSDSDPAFGHTRIFDLDNSLTGRVGASYDFSEQFTLSGGFAYGISPFDGSHLLPEVPDANKILFTFGATYRITDRFQVNAGAGVENFFERQGEDIGTGLAGTYKTIRYMGGLSLNLAF